MASNKGNASEVLKNKRSPIFDFFHYECDDEKNVQCTCIIPKDNDFVGGVELINAECPNSCKKKFKKPKCSTLKNHIKRYHKALFEELEKKERTESSKVPTTSKSQSVKGTNSTNNQNQKRKGEVIDYFEKKKMKKVSLIYDIRWLYKGIVELVAVDGEPFTVVHKTGFQTLYGPVAKALGVSLYPDKVKDMIREEAKQHRQLLAETLNARKLLPLKFDFAKNQGKSFLGVNTQIFKCGKIETYSLGCLEVFERHTAENVKPIITQLLHQFELNLENIIANTTDNGANCVKTTRLMDDEQILKHFKTMYNLPESLSGKDIDDLFESLADLEISSEDDGSFDQMIEKINDAFGIAAVKCGAHSFQLGILDVLPFKKKKKKDKKNKSDNIEQDEDENEEEDEDDEEEPEEEEANQCDTTSFKDHLLIIKKVRRVAKKLRTPKNMNVLRKNQSLMPILDCPTRWNSTYFMLERIVKLKEIMNNPNINVMEIRDDEWDLIQELLKILEPFKKASIKMQNANAAYTDLYVIFKILEMKVKKIDSPLAKELLHRVRTRLSSILSSEIFKAAMVLDPRINMDLKSEDKEVAVKFLISLASRLNIINAKTPQANSPSADSDSDILVEANDEGEDEDSSIAELEKELKKKKEEALKEKVPNVDIANLEKEIDNFLKEPMLLLKRNILEYWNERENHRLYPLAIVLLAIPFAQVSVERMFSVLKFIHNPNRTRLGSEILNEVMFLHSNYNKFY